MQEQKLNYYCPQDELDEELTIDLKKIFLALWSRKFLIAKIFVAVFLFFVLMTFISAKKYTVDADLYINKTNNSNMSEINPYFISEVGTGGGMAALMSGGGNLMNELEIMQSPLVIDKVIQENDLRFKKLFGIIHPNRLIMRLKLDNDLNILNWDDSAKQNKNLFEYLSIIQDKINFINIYFNDHCHNNNGFIEKVAKRIQDFLKEKNIKMRLSITYNYSSVSEIKKIIDMNIIPLLEVNFWSSKITFGDIFSEIINYSKLQQFSNPYNEDKTILVPVVVINDDDNLPLSIVYTTKEGIKKSVDEKRCYFYNREQRKLIIPDINSSLSHSNVENITQISFNCDRSAILFVVSGGNFCNKFRHSCFNWNKTFSGGIRDLEKIIKTSVKYGGEKSYTKKIATNQQLVLCKLIEEANEVWCASSSSIDNLRYEISDFIYFLTIFCVSVGVDINTIYSELIRRHFALNPRLEEKNPSSLTGLRLGMCLSKYYQENLFQFIKTNGLDIRKEPNSLKYHAKFTFDDSIKIKPFLIKPKDVFRFIEKNLMDAVICFQDILDNYPCSYSKINFPNKETDNMSAFSISKICVISNKGFDLTPFKKNPLKKLIIFSEYNYLTTKWIDQQGITAKIVVVNGANEGLLLNGLCDLIVCVVSTGQTLKANDLVILDTIYESRIGLYVKKGLEQEIQNLINKSKV